MLLLHHLLALWLVFVSPVWDWFDTRSLKSNPTARARLRYYQQTIVILASAAGVACWADGTKSLFTAGGLGIHESGLATYSWLWWLLTTLVVSAVLLQWVLPITQILVKYRKLAFLEMRQLQPLRFVLPASQKERRWYAVLGITAAVCEELVVRGFLLRYLHTWPYHLELGQAVLAAAVVFGLNHIYQGVKGAMVTGLTGLIFTAMLLVTGSLWTGMAFHAVTNLSILVYWRPRPLEDNISHTAGPLPYWR